MNTAKPHQIVAIGFSGALARTVTSPFRPGRAIFSLLLGCAISAWSQLKASGAEDYAAVAISAKVSSDYIRPRLADGKFATETFAFGKGGAWAGASRDETIDGLSFTDIARTVAGPLASQNYVASKDPHTTKLLIMVYWGTTHAPENSNTSVAMQNLQSASESMVMANIGSNMTSFDNGSSGWTKPAMASNTMTQSSIPAPAQSNADQLVTSAMAVVAAENRVRDRLDASNAALLGYDSAWAQSAQDQGTAFATRRQDLSDELEESRYFVVLMAYDFQTMWKQKKNKLLWETRFSMRERGNDFAKQLAAMAQNAAGYFGQPSKGLVHRELPQGHVEVGPEKVLAYGQAH